MKHFRTKHDFQIKCFVLHVSDFLSEITIINLNVYMNFQIVTFQISAVVFRLSASELLIQSIGEDMFFCLQTKAVDCEETGNISYEDFYAKLSSQQGVLLLRTSSQTHQNKDFSVI